MEKNKSQVVAMRGINYSNMIADGDMVDSKNISARAYPYITTRKGRELLEDLSGATAMTMFQGELVYVKGTDLYWGDGVWRNKVTPGEKQFAVINSKLVIMPDKKYINGETKGLGYLGASRRANATFDKNAVKVSDSYATYISSRNCTKAGTRLNIPPMKQFASKTGNVQIRLEGGTKASADSPVATGVARVYFGEVIDISTGWVHCGNKSVGGNKYIPYIEFSSNLSEVAKASISVGDTVQISTGGMGGTGPNPEPVYFRAVIESIDGNIFYCQELNSGYFGYESRDVHALVREADVDYDASVAANGYLFIDLKDEDGGVESKGYKLNDSKRIPIAHEVYDHWYHGNANNGGNTKDLSVILEGDSVRLRSGSATQDLTVQSVGEDYIEFKEQITLDIDPFNALEVEVKAESLGGAFKAGDAVTIAGSKTNDITFIVGDIQGNTIYAESDIFTATTESEIFTIERKIPDLDYICESDNRIWGCSNSDNTIYASALGDPTNFFDYSGESTDSYAVAVGSSERFTACCRYGGAVLFFKENKIHKVLGSYPAEYTLYSYDVEGVQEGSHKSLQTINEVLYYKGIHGVFAYNGSPRLISANFGEKSFGSAVAGNDGDTYYISMSDESRGYLFAYETKYGMWVLEDDLKVVDFIKSRSTLRMLAEGGKFFLCDAGESETGIEWHIQFAPFYETIEGKKSYSRIVFRLEIPQGSYMIVDVKTDGGAWREAGKVVGKRDGIIPVNVPINRCDKFEIRLRGKGKCTIHQMKREFFVGGDK
jgi:hypothetical protein